MNNQIPFPILKTERLYLREMNEADIDTIHYFRSDPEINRFIKRAEPQTMETAVAHLELITIEFKKNKSITWGITLKESAVLIGSICLWNFSEDRKTAEVGYNLDTKFQRQGFMGEALKAVIDFGFNQSGFETIEAFTDYRNISSKKLLKLHGFIPNSLKIDVDNQFNEVYYLNR